MPGLAVAATVCGVAAGWAAARHPSFDPLLWTTLLVTCLALPNAQRRLLDSRWLLVGLLLVGSSWLVAADHELALRHSLLFVAAALVFGVTRLGSPDDRLVALLALGLASTSVVAIAQVGGGLGAAQADVSTLPPAWQEAAATRLRVGRAFGTAALPGHYAALLMLAVPILAERAWRSRRWNRAGWAATLGLVATAIALTRSLAAVAVGCALLLPFLKRALRNRWVWLGAGALAVVAAVVVASRTDLGRLEPVRLRWVNWRTAAWVFAHHPWLGVGTGGVGQAALAGPTGALNITPYTHNTPLQLLAEFGAAGALPLALGIGALVLLVRRGWSSHPGLTLAVASLPLHNLVDFSAYAPEVLLPWAVLAGALAARVTALPERALRSWLLVALLGTGTVVSACAWRSEAETVAPLAGGKSRLEAAMDAARWAPWSVTPVELAAAEALATRRPARDLARIDAELLDRGWVQPLSARWAECRGRLLLAEGRPGEAATWVREARRRAPWRGDLAQLEVVCAPRR